MHLVDHLVVCDLSEKMLKQAKKKGTTSPIQSHAEKLPFSDGSFERIIVVDSFHHFSKHKLTVFELLRVLHLDGKLIIEEPDIARLQVKLVALAEKLFLMQSHFFSPGQIRDMFLAAGANVTIEHDGKYTAWIIIEK